MYVTFSSFLALPPPPLGLLAASLGLSLKY